jgi:TolB-like protein
LSLKNIANPIVAYAAETSTEPPDDVGGPPSLLDLSQPVPGFGGRPAVAVLPFKYSGEGLEYEFLADGFADDLIAGLSHVRWFPVISRYSSFVFRNDMLDPKSVGRALGARYLVTGSLRLIGYMIRLTVSLIDAENGINLWCHQYDIDFKKIFEIQDEVAASIVSVLESAVDKAEQSRCRARKAEDLSTWELIRRGTWHLSMLTKEDSAKALEFFKEALKRDPNSGEARIQLAWWLFWDVWTRRGNKCDLAEMEELARQAMRIDPEDGRAPMLVGIAQLMMGKSVHARPYLREAIRSNPSLAPAHGALGSTYILAGEPEKGVEPLLLSVRLNPQDLYSFHYLGELAISFHLQRDWEKACEFAERALQLRPGYWYAKAIAIASLARGGQRLRARRIIEEGHCNFSENQINWLPFVDKKWNEYLLEGLEMAGCPIVRDR